MVIRVLVVKKYSSLALVFTSTRLYVIQLLSVLCHLRRLRHPPPFHQELLNRKYPMI